ncbi:MAG: hypothetical protein ACXABY_02980 [Candidatus Thorarchaeota archaeon]|jgi:hypothetical protein
MVCDAGRFTPCEGDGFPAISNYDFETNIPIRGIDDRDFRWEDVVIPATYLFQEATISGSFEDNLYRQNNGGSLPNGETGLNPITDLDTLSDATGYLGWTVTGAFSYYVGISGLVASSGELSGFTGSLTAHPIERNESIGFYVGNYTAPEGAESVRIISEGLHTGETGVLPDGRHQVYLLATAPYSGTVLPEIRAYMRGYNAGSVVAYHEPISGGWMSSPPTSGFVIESSGYTTIQYDFITSDFPAATPTGYDLVVETFSTGSFIVIDDVHVDAYLERDAFVSYTLPTGYMFQVTPDIGWHDTLAMFDDSIASRNPHLRTYGPFVIDLGNLVDNLDNSVTATLDETDFNEITNDKYKKYLWRAIALSPNGILGDPGFPQRFEFVGRELESQFSVGVVFDDPLSSVKVVTGTKGSRMTIIVNDDEDYEGLEYPSETKWKLTVHMTQPIEVLAIRGKDPGGARTSVQYVELTSQLFAQNYQALWNVFDEHGLLMDTERLPRELNADYADRIQDVMLNPGGSSFVGVVNGGARELGLDKILDGLTLSIVKNDFNRPRHDEVEFEVAGASIRFRSASMVRTENLLVDPVYQTVQLSKRPRDLASWIEVEDGGRIGIDEIEEAPEVEDRPSLYRLKINNEVARGKVVNIRYEYYEELFFKDYPDLDTMKAAMEAITDPAGFPVLEAVVSPLLSGGEDCFGLYISNTLVTATAGTATIPWSPLFLRKVSDKAYREHFISTAGTYRDTQFYEYVKELKANNRTFWGHVEVDRDVWDAADSKDQAMDDIPTLFDPSLAYFYSLNEESEVVRVESVQAWARNYSGLTTEFMFNLGIDTPVIQAGVAYIPDLKPEIHTEFSLLPESEEKFGNVGTQRNNNNVTFFSGQR